nr:hypothetical protein CFP56_51961 [Quercus suber]
MSVRQFDLSKVQVNLFQATVQNTENLSSTSRTRLIENEDRLPGAVLLARARLQERSRGVPLSANRSDDGSNFLIWLHL